MAIGVAYLHNRKPPIYHGDISSVRVVATKVYWLLTFCAHQKNVVLASSGRALLCGFGFGSTTTKPRTFDAGRGTTAYMAPETMLHDDGPRSKETDIWALGCLIWFVSTRFATTSVTCPRPGGGHS